MICYPIITYNFLSKRVDRLEDVDEKNLRLKHRAVFANLRYFRKERMGLGFIFFIHYRRLIYSIIVVLLQDNPAQQIQLIMFISLALIITVMNSMPFYVQRNNYTESLNEACLLILCYHLLIFSDFVPAYETIVK